MTDNGYRAGPHFARLRTALLRQGEPDRVPLHDHVDAYLKRRVLGLDTALPATRTHGSMAASGRLPLEHEVAFATRVGYDYVSLGATMHATITGTATLVAARYAAFGDEEQERGWANEGDGIITTLREFESFPWPDPAECDTALFEQAPRLLPPGMEVLVDHGKVFTGRVVADGHRGLLSRDQARPSPHRTDVREGGSGPVAHLGEGTGLMKLGLGLYRWMLTPHNFRFARQAGATHIVAHLTDYFASADSLSTGSGNDVWGVTRNQGKYWTYRELRDLVAAVETEGLTLEALENFDPAFWSDILLDGPHKDEQIEGIKGLIRNMGRAGIPIMGYYFSLAGVWGRTNRLRTRGDAVAVGYVREYIESEPPIPNGQVWNMVYDPDAPPGSLGPVTHEQMLARRKEFLDALLPVAEEAGVRLAAHPDDPPLATLRGTARLITQHAHYQDLLDAFPSPANALEFCVGTLAEMTEGDIYACADQFSRQGKIGYVHLRNVVGKVPNYHEVFVDEGDTDMYRVLSILHANQFDGVLIPDHTPQMACDAPWHAGMAYSLGWMRATISAIERGG